tara:strand:- start:285 stop:1169 length:885 start_codon:yes stop_codon:yes gene_type:complete
MYDYTFLVCTREKSIFFDKFLKSINNLKLNKKKIKLIIVENSKKKTLYNKIRQKLKKEISYIYEIEKKIGIPYARNKAIRISKRFNTKYICFFDDDCEINKNWLIEIEKFKKKFKTDIITGPQIPKVKNLFLLLLMRKAKDGEKLQWAATNNVILKQEIIKKEKIKFNEKLANLGGSDQLFFMMLNERGYKIKWCKDAKVYENIILKKKKLVWFIKRNFRYGISSKIIYLCTYGYLKGFRKLFLKFFYELFLSAIYFLSMPFKLKLYFLKFSMYISRSIGTFLGIFGFKTSKYI